MEAQRQTQRYRQTDTETEIQSLVSAIVRESKDMTIPSLQEEAAHLFIQIVMF